MQVLLEKVTILFEAGMNREEIARELQLTNGEVETILDLYEQKLNELKSEIDDRSYC